MVNLNNMFELLKEKNITAKKLSEATGISSGNISDWKSGRSMPSAIKLSAIADYLGCSVDYLLGRDKYIPINQTTGDVNEGVVIGHATGDTAITVGTSALNKMEKELLRLFNSIDIKEQMKIMQQLYDIEENAQQNKKNTGVNKCE